MVCWSDEAKMVFSACAAFLALIAFFLSPLAAAATSGRIERGVISDMAVVGDDQNAGFSGESIGMGLILHLLRFAPFRGTVCFLVCMSRGCSWPVSRVMRSGAS